MGYTEYVVFVVPRHRDHQLDREFDAAFDLEACQFARLDGADTTFTRVVHNCVRLVHADLTPGSFDGADSLVDERIGLRVTVMGDAVRIGLLADPAPADAEYTVGLVQRLVAALTVTLGWIAFDPAQRVAVRPTEAYRDGALALLRGHSTEPDGRHVRGAV
ncbi:hypothetical protein ACWDUM_26040 [Rhodococcus sp. NPDC003322]